MHMQNNAYSKFLCIKHKTQKAVQRHLACVYINIIQIGFIHKCSLSTILMINSNKVYT